MALRCIACRSGFSIVQNTYEEIHYTHKGRSYSKLPRRRKCKHCGYTWMTYEDTSEEDKDSLPSEEDNE